MFAPRKHLKLSLIVTGIILGIFLLPYIVGVIGMGLIWYAMNLEKQPFETLLLTSFIVTTFGLCIWRRRKVKRQRANL